MHASRLTYKIIKFTALTLFIMMQIFLIFVNKHNTLDLDIAPNTQPSPNIFGGLQIGQTFYAPRDGLSRIDIKLGTFRRTNTKDIVFSLYQIEPDDRLVFTTTINASEVKDNIYHPFSFKSLKRSKGERYSFTLASPESTPDDSICVWTNTQNIYSPGEYYINDVPSSGDIIFRVYSKRPVFTELPRIVQNYSGLFGRTWILILVIIFFEAVQILVFSKLLDFFYQTWRRP